MFLYVNTGPLVSLLNIPATNSCDDLVSVSLCLGQARPVHTGNPGVEKSTKFISLNIAIIVGVKTDMVGARLSMEGSIIKS